MLAPPGPIPGNGRPLLLAILVLAILVLTVLGLAIRVLAVLRHPRLLRQLVHELPLTVVRAATV